MNTGRFSSVGSPQQRLAAIASHRRQVCQRFRELRVRSGHNQPLLQLAWLSLDRLFQCEIDRLRAEAEVTRG